ncbi:histidine kinase CKI1 [Pistacia vera]|uniref:histidine kinase CKI1 n=1 Tax=Pistacia vera TaxID=55513 RepID=UPI001262FA20|nr:histidine kinase CKI1 [Pistacia vera]
MISARPVLITVFTLLAFVVLLLPSLLIAPYWYKMIQRIKQDVDLDTYNLHLGLQSEIESVSKLLHPMNSMATNLARVISSSLNGTEISFSKIETKVAPSLFEAFSTIPHISQISYIGLDGFFFSYYIDNNQTLAVFFNSSFSFQSSVTRKNYTWYRQPVDIITGRVYGEAIIIPTSSINTTWLQEALNSTTGYASLGTGWNKAGNSLFLNTVSVRGIRGAVSLGFPVKTITDFYTAGINLFGGSLSMTTIDGEVLVEGLPNTRMIVTHDSISLQLKKTNGQQLSHVEYVSCAPGNAITNIVKIAETDYNIYCSLLEIAGVKSVYALAVPQKGLVSLVHKTSKFALILLALMITSVVISVLSFVFMMVRGAKREMHLCAALIKQMEATQQAERKSMNKSTAFASASHDIRASLAGITGLIGISYNEVAPGSDLETNLRQMDGCAKDLLNLLNSILDTSKIEAGKMKLVDEDFNLSEFLEDVVDLYHPVGMKKGVDVILDPYDGSVIKFAYVKGDRGKLKQVLSNLLSNAVKFTSEGHISVRAWVRKPSLETSMLASNRNGLLQRLSRLFYKSNEANDDLQVVNAARNNPNAMEFVFEVSDTGKGIPKDKQKLVFENYVQVKDGQGGTGLGLGIVQSLVRLMGGDIGIVDKAPGERGTCFRFNVFLSVSDQTSSGDNIKGDTELRDDFASSSTQYHQHQHHMGLTISAPTPGLTIRTPSPRLTILSSSPKLGGSQVVLLISNEERLRISQTFMESLGINVSVVNQWERLQSLLKKMKSKLNHSPHGSFRKSDISFRSDISSSSSKDVPLSAMEGTDHKLPAYKRRGAAFVLLVIDANSGPFEELYNAVTEFRRGLQCYCKVVWLGKPTSRSSHFDEGEMLDPNDEIITKPFHGSRLCKIIKFLPEFGGTLSQGNSARSMRKSRFQVGETSRDPSQSYAKSSYVRSKIETPEEGISNSEKSKDRNLPTQTEIEEEYGEASDGKPLSGKRILVADDSPLLRRLAVQSLENLGATVESCENGEEALQKVLVGLAPDILPYYFILMDCEMPKMDGKEATKQIRKEEKRYGVHIPIIALTAHGSGDVADETILAGMDVHLVKPLNKEHLMEAIRYIHNKGYV